MKKIFFLLLTITSFNVHAQKVVQSTKPGESTRQELLQKIQDFTAVWANSDSASLANQLSDDYRHTDIFGKILHRQEWLTYAASPRKILGIEMTDVEILLYNDNLAIVTGKMSYQFGEEKLIQEIRFTQVWSSDGHWKRATFHATLIDKSK